jgi:metal-responsive CopG/Arc/MetJ family transcriptional regulator
MVSNAMSVGISLPEQIVEKIDRDRGDVSRSRFLLRLVEHAYKEREVQN